MKQSLSKQDAKSNRCEFSDDPRSGFHGFMKTQLIEVTQSVSSNWFR